MCICPFSCINLSFSEKIQIVATFIQLIIAFGVILAYAQYSSKRKRDDEEGLSPKLDIQKRENENLILFDTTVTNSTSRNIKIEYAFIVITPHDKFFLHEINENFGCCFIHSDELIKLQTLKQRDTIKPKQCFVFPLEYYSSENIRVGNETLRYVLPLQLEKDNNKYNLWDVRFFVFPDDGRHRSVHSVFKGNIDELKNNLQNQNQSKKIKPTN